MKNYLLAIVVIVTVASCSQKTAPVAVTPAPEKAPAKTPPVKQPLNGVALYGENCARCHGATGTANGNAPGIDRPIGKYHIVDIINNGAGGMPRFAEKLSPDEIDAIADFVMKLSVSSK